MKAIDRNRAYYRLDAETRLRKESVDFAVKIMKILPHAYKTPISVLDFAHVIHRFITDRLREDIDKLPSDIVKGLRNKYGNKDPFGDLI